MADLINYSIELENEDFKKLQKEILQVNEFLIKNCACNYLKNLQLFRETFMQMAKEDTTFIQYLKN